MVDRVHPDATVPAVPTLDTETRLPSRPHNTVVWNHHDDTVTKTSRDMAKIAAEARWFTLADPQHQYTPELLGQEHHGNTASYTMRHIKHPTIGSYLNGQAAQALNTDALLQAMADLIQVLHVHDNNRDASERADDTYAMYVTKTQERLDRTEPYVSSRLWHDGITLNGRRTVPLGTLVELLPDLVHNAGLDGSRPFTRIHGDLCGGNMLYDPRTHHITLIDPRGSFGQATTSGDPAYDLAKLTHSFLGGYDALLAGRAQHTGNTLTVHLHPAEEPFTHWLNDTCAQRGIPRGQVDLIHALLFLSLAALHGENQQTRHLMLLRGLDLLNECTS